MKNIQAIFYLATMIGGVLSVASCNNENETITASKQVPLEIQTGSVQTTRSIIEGSTLPEECQYGIFAMYGKEREVIDGGMNVCVNYSKGVSTLNKSVYLPTNVDVPVYAYYPYNANYSNIEYLLEMPVDVTTQTDYLYGYSADNDFKLTYVKDTQPKATIYFKHAMARVTMRIKKATDNENTYKFPYINLLNVDKSAYLNILDGGTILDPTGTANLTAKPSDYVLENSDNEIVADFLVIPGNTEGKKVLLNMSDDISSFENGLSAAVPVTNWQAGQQYTYTVTIDTYKVLSISEATITPWINNNQEEIKIGDENYAGIPVNGPVGQAVDLGLSVKWANWNIGASAPEEYGGLYGWADPTGTKISILNEDYPNSNPPSDICGSIYDIARAQWGKDWRLPSKDEIEELSAQCTWIFTTLNDISGYKVEAQNGNSIFLPLTKERSGTNLYDFERGFYWSGTLDTSMSIGGISNYAYNIWFSKDGTGCSSNNRYNGMAIRPVTK